MRMVSLRLRQHPFEDYEYCLDRGSQQGKLACEFEATQGQTHAIQGT